jgi:hypothetical protein
MLSESVLITEIFAETKRRDLERGVERQRLLADIGQQDTGLHPRRAVAGALVRLATLIDSNAGTRTAAAAH